MYTININSTIALTCELKLFDAPFLSTDDTQFSWLKHQFLKYDWPTAVEVRPRVYEKIEEQKIFTSPQTYEWHKNHCTYCNKTLHIKFSIMYKVSNVFAERFIQDQLELAKLS